MAFYKISVGGTFLSSITYQAKDGVVEIIMICKKQGEKKLLFKQRNSPWIAVSAPNRSEQSSMPAICDSFLKTGADTIPVPLGAGISLAQHDHCSR